MAKYIAGKNIGRQTRANDKQAVYRMTGRSTYSRDRVIVQQHSKNFDFEFWVKAIKPLPSENVNKAFSAGVMEYMCLAKLKTDENAGDILLLGNGIQTADIAKEIYEAIDKAKEDKKGNNEAIKEKINEIDYRNILKENLLNHGVEPDNVTPRTACVIRKPKESPFFKEAHFGTVFPSPNGIVRKEGTVPGEVYTITVDINASEPKGTVHSLATYKGQTPGLEHSTELVISEPLPIGTIAPGQELAEAEYKELQKRYWVVEEDEGQVDTAVATVAVVILGPDKFSLGVCNRHKIA